MLAALMGGDKQDSYAGGDPMKMVENCLNDLHSLMAALPDAQDTALVHAAMKPLLQIQAKYHSAAQQGSQQQQILSKLGGGQ